MTLQLTKKELQRLVCDDLGERFEEIFNDIPFYHEDHEPTKGETHRSYMEDDGREFRWYIFKDTLTGIEYCINYTFNPEWENDFDDMPNGIEIVEKSVLFPEVPVVAPAPVLTAEEQANADMWAQYRAIEADCRKVEKKEKLKEVPEAKKKEILAFLKTKSFSMRDLQNLIIPVCIEHKLEQKSFWTWIQVKSGAWK
jgi:hypothetical protein